MKNQRDEVISFYKESLATLRINTDKTGKAMLVNPDDTESDAIVNDKPLYLPVKGTLDGDMMDEVQHFHPLCEALPRKSASPVITYMTKVARMNIGMYLKVIIERLMVVAADPNLHDELPPETTDYFKKLQNVNDKTVVKLEKLINAAVRKNALVTVYCKSGGVYEGESVTRLCTIRFPVIGMIEANDTKSLKFSFSSERERKTILALFNYVLPGGYDHETYSAPSNSKVAPFFEAFMLAYEKVITQLNKLINRHGDSMDFQLEPFPTRAFKKLDKLPEYYNDSRIPTLPGNEGGLKELEEVKKNDHAKTPPPNPNAASRNTTPPWTDEPVATPTRSPQTRPATPQGGSQSMEEYRRLMQGGQPQQPQSQYQQQNWQQQQMGYQNQMQQMQYPQQMQNNNPYAVLGQNQQPQQMQHNNWQQQNGQYAGYQQQPQQNNMGHFNNDPGAGII